MSDAGLHFEPLERRHNREAFSSGETLLDTYLKRYARQNIELCIAAVIVLNDPVAHRIVGYYTLVASSVEVQDFPHEISRKLPDYDVPVFLLARLAVDLEYQGRGFGALLLMHALRQSLEIAERAAAMAVIVDAKHEFARAFYVRHNFKQMPDYPNRLFLPMNYIRQLLAKPTQ